MGKVTDARWYPISILFGQKQLKPLQCCESRCCSLKVIKMSHFDKAIVSVPLTPVCFHSFQSSSYSNNFNNLKKPLLSTFLTPSLLIPPLIYISNKQARINAILSSFSLFIYFSLLSFSIFHWYFIWGSTTVFCLI